MPSNLFKLNFILQLKPCNYIMGVVFRPFTKFLTKLGISSRLTCPHTSHQNGTLERKHIHIIEMCLTLMSHASIPLQYWEHSFATSFHVINTFTFRGLIKFQSPYHALFHKLPRSDTRVWMFLFSIYSPLQQTKMDFRSQECVFTTINNTSNVSCEMHLTSATQER